MHVFKSTEHHKSKEAYNTFFSFIQKPSNTASVSFISKQIKRFSFSKVQVLVLIVVSVCNVIGL